MAKYRKKPVVNEAMQWTGDNIDALWDWAGAGNIYGPLPVGDELAPEGRKLKLYVAANEAWLDLEVGEWIIRDSRGFYPCKADIFEQTYKAVDDRTQGLTADELAVCIDVALYGAPSVYTAPEMFMPRRDLIAETIKANPLIAGI